MNLKLLGWNDTIVALATPPGIGAIGVIRLSGRDAIAITAGLFPKKPLAAQPSHTLHVGYLQNGNSILDEVVVALYQAPKSYTGENVTEISCHGSPYIQEQILQACISKGARLAKPGEFTQRAFLAGKLDLTQAEAVADLIASESSAARDAALHNLRGGFATELKIIRDELISVSALLELELDFAGEDVEFADRAQLYSLLQHAAVKVQRMADSFKLGNAVKNGVKVAIIGKPNAGKSTLLNALLNEERAIVSEIAGTTRDTIEEVLNIDGLLFRFIDTAGLRDESSDIIESIGIERSRKTAAEADIILYVYDASNPDIQTLDEVEQWLTSFKKPYLFLLNKTDIASQQSLAEIKNAVLLSARERTGIDELKHKIKNLIISNDLNPETTLITNSRHYTALQQILYSIQEIKAGMDAGLPGDLLSIDMRTCLHHLGEITGEVTNEDQLSYIFSKFCIGK